MTTALVFPGQGSQTVGMGKALAEAFPAARDVFAQVDAALGESLSKVIFEGPEAELTLTANAQPALMATSLAALRALESEAGLDVARDAAFVAGHSLGEYSALCAAGALTLEDAARLLRIRGAAMQQAVPVGEGAMAAILGLEFDAVTAIAAEAAKDGGVCQAANDNGGGQVVISGAKARGRAGDGDRQGQRRQARAAAAGVGAVPLRVDAAGGLRDGGGAGDDDDSQAEGSAGRQCHRRPAQRSRGDSRQPRLAGDRRGALARERAVHGGSGRRSLHRDRRRQGSGRPGQAHRGERERDKRRDAGRRRGL